MIRMTQLCKTKTQAHRQNWLRWTVYVSRRWYASNFV